MTVEFDFPHSLLYFAKRLKTVNLALTVAECMRYIFDAVKASHTFPFDSKLYLCMKFVGMCYNNRAHNQTNCSKLEIMQKWRDELENRIRKIEKLMRRTSCTQFENWNMSHSVDIPSIDQSNYETFIYFSAENISQIHLCAWCTKQVESNENLLFFSLLHISVASVASVVWFCNQSFLCL